jgi:hypothetical protein
MSLSKHAFRIKVLFFLVRVIIIIPHGATKLTLLLFSNIFNHKSDGFGERTQLPKELVSDFPKLQANLVLTMQDQVVLS